MMQQPAYEKVAAWALGAYTGQIPVSVAEHAKRAILDGVGVSLAARGGRVSGLLESLPEFVPVEATEATILGHSLMATAGNSAFAIGALAHELDFDDSNADLAGHPTAVVLAAALSVGQSMGATGSQLLAAYSVGVEVACSFGRLLNPQHYDSGWHPTCTLGIFGAATAASCLLSLNESQFAQALALASAMASGTKVTFGTLAKPIMVGRAAMNGVAATQCIMAGADADTGAFEDRQGYLAVLQRRQADGLVLTLPGEQEHGWSLCDPGIIIKRYPCCGSTHASIDAAILLKERVRQKNVESCVVRVHPARRGHVDRPNPISGLEAKFSLQYTVATALRHGTVALRDFSDPTRIFADETRRMMARIRIEDLETCDERPEDRFAAELEIRAGTECLRERVPFAKGRERGTMLPLPEIRDKFVECTATLGAARQQRLATLLLDLENQESVRDVLMATQVGASTDAPLRPGSGAALRRTMAEKEEGS